MQVTGMGSGICNAAVVRAADAMLHSLGGEEVSILLPRSATPGDAAGQLGLADPGIEEVKIAPVIVRNLPTDNAGPRRRVEFLLSVSGLSTAATTRGFANLQQLMQATLGIVFEGELFHVEGFTAEHFGGAAYLYRLVGVE